MQNKKKNLKFSEAINDALHMMMKKNKNVIVLGLGSEDPKEFLEQQVDC